MRRAAGVALQVHITVRPSIACSVADIRQISARSVSKLNKSEGRLHNHVHLLKALLNKENEETLTSYVQIGGTHNYFKGKTKEAS